MKDAYKKKERKQLILCPLSLLSRLFIPFFFFFYTWLLLHFGTRGRIVIFSLAAKERNKQEANNLRKEKYIAMFD